MNPHQTSTILVIDDDAALTHALTRRLSATGYRCVTAASGAQGLAEFESAPVELIVSDLSMPGGDGVAMAHSVRRTSNVPIIFITGFKDQFKRRLRGVSNVMTLRKPFTSQELAELVSMALRWDADAFQPVGAGRADL